MAEHDTYSLPIRDMALKNDEFRNVVWTGDKAQLVLMAIPEGGEIPGETHEGHDQLLYFVQGTGKATIGDSEIEVGDGDVAMVPSGVYHRFQNTGSGMLKLFTSYSPPEHEPGTEHGTLEEAEAEEA